MPSKIEFVSLAVGAQLSAEQKPVDDWTLVFGADLKYDIFTIQLFLVQVERTLALGNPKYKFIWDEKFAKSALKRSILDLIGDISDASTATTAAPSAKGADANE